MALEEPPEQKQQRKLMLIMQAIELLKQDKLRGFRIDIETDSTVQGDAAEEKAARTEFIGQVTKFVEVAAQTTMGVPEFAPLAAKMLQFAVRGFRVGRDLESAIEDFCEKAELDAKEKAANPRARPDPEKIKADAEQAKAMAEIERQKIENQGEQANSAVNLQLKQLDFEMKKLDQQIALIKAKSELAKASADNDNQERSRAMEGHAAEEHQGKMAEFQAFMEQAGKHHQGLLEQMHDHVSQTQQLGGALAEHMKNMLGEHLNALHEHINAPVELKRGPDGMAVSVVKGGVERKIHRGPDGKVARLQ